MKVTRIEIVKRGLSNRCPNCGGDTLFQEGHWFLLNPECPTCGIKIERDEGFFLGSMSINYAVTIVCYLLPLLGVALAGWISVLTAIILAAAGVGLVPVLFYRSSRSWWLMLYYFFVPQHLPANQPEPVPGSDDNI